MEKLYLYKVNKKQNVWEHKRNIWLSKISFSKEGENNIRGCFDVEVNFKYPKNLE